MQNIELNNGNLVTIGSLDDALNLIAENLSHDLKNYIQEYLDGNEFDYQECQEELDILQNDFEELEQENNRLTDENWKQRNEIMDLKREIERLVTKESNSMNISDDELPFC